MQSCEKDVMDENKHFKVPHPPSVLCLSKCERHLCCVLALSKEKGVKSFCLSGGRREMVTMFLSFCHSSNMVPEWEHSVFASEMSEVNLPCVRVCVCENHYLSMNVPSKSAGVFLNSFISCLLLSFSLCQCIHPLTIPDESCCRYEDLQCCVTCQRGRVSMLTVHAESMTLTDTTMKKLCVCDWLKPMLGKQLAWS